MEGGQGRGWTQPQGMRERRQEKGWTQRTGMREGGRGREGRKEREWTGGIQEREGRERREKEAKEWATRSRARRRNSAGGVGHRGARGGDGPATKDWSNDALKARGKEGKIYDVTGVNVWTTGGSVEDARGWVEETVPLLPLKKVEEANSWFEATVKTLAPLEAELLSAEELELAADLQQKL